MVSKRLLESLRVPFTEKFLKEKILTHPQYPSLLAIADTLEEYGIEPLAVKFGKDRLADFPLPGIVQVSLTDGTYFNTVTNISEDVVSIFDEKGKKKDISQVDFLKIWTGISLLVEVGEEASEPEIQQKIIEQKIFKGILWLFTLFVLIWVGLGLKSGLKSWSIQSIEETFLAYFLAKLSGLVAAGVLLWYQLDKENPTLQKFCVAGKMVDCDEVLNSKAFQLLDGRISPSILAFAYFLAGMGLLTVFPTTSITILTGLSLATLPVIFYSFYYQAKITKKWCRFCLVIQSVLVLEVVAVLKGAFWSGGFDISSASLFLILFTGVIIGGIFINPLIGKEDDVFKAKRELTKLKSNKELFEMALSRSRKIENKPEGLGILLKGEGPKYQIIKVCNPFCGPCSRVHPILEDLFEKGNIDLQILFTPAEGDEKKEKVIRHMMSVDGIGNPEFTRKALNDWYSTDKKDYDDFAARHPTILEPNILDEKVRIMGNWCNSELISHTPTIFINGFELPSEYSVKDLRYLLV